MTVVKNSDSLLILKSKPSLRMIITITMWAIAYIIIAPIAIFNLLLEGGKYNFFCERIEPQIVDCLSQQYPLLPVFNIKNTIYNNVKSATYIVEESRSSKGRITYRYYVVLRTDRGSFSIYKGNSYLSNSLANQINNFLASKETEFIFIQPPSVAKAVQILFILLLSVVGIFALHFFLRWETFILDKKERKFTWICYSILGKRSVFFNLSEIKGTDIKTHSYKGRQFYNTKLLAGRKQYNILTTTNQLEAQKRANLVEFFLSSP